MNRQQIDCEDVADPLVYLSRRIGECVEDVVYQLWLLVVCAAELLVAHQLARFGESAGDAADYQYPVRLSLFQLTQRVDIDSIVSIFIPVLDFQPVVHRLDRIFGRQRYRRARLIVVSY